MQVCSCLGPCIVSYKRSRNTNAPLPNGHLSGALYLLVKRTGRPPQRSHQLDLGVCALHFPDLQPPSLFVLGKAHDELLPAGKMTCDSIRPTEAGPWALVGVWMTVMATAV